MLVAASVIGISTLATKSASAVSRIWHLPNIHPNAANAGEPPVVEQANSAWATPQHLVLDSSKDQPEFVFASACPNMPAQFSTGCVYRADFHGHVRRVAGAIGPPGPYVAPTDGDPAFTANISQIDQLAITPAGETLVVEMDPYRSPNDPPENPHGAIRLLVRSHLSGHAGVTQSYHNS